MKFAAGTGLAMTLTVLSVQANAQSMTPAEFTPQYTEVCKQRVSAAPGMCECMAGIGANDEFSDQQRAWLVFSMTDSKQAKAIAEQMSAEDRLGVGTFMINAGGKCAG